MGEAAGLGGVEVGVGDGGVAFGVEEVGTSSAESLRRVMACAAATFMPVEIWRAPPMTPAWGGS